MLRLKPGASEAEIEAAYREESKVMNPDRGGSHDAMTRLNETREAVLKKVA
jgi:curved DNA-binding protein CbpA